MFYRSILTLSMLISSSTFAADTAKATKNSEKSSTKPAEVAKEVMRDVGTAEVFDFDGKEKLFDYSFKREYTPQGFNYTAQFKDLTGETMAQEKVEIVDGQIKHFEAERKSSKDKGTIEMRDGRIFFTYIEEGKKTTNYEKISGNTLVSASLCPFLESHWDDLMAKKDVEFRYAVWYRKETIGFKFSYDREEGEYVVFQMNPTNLFYRSLVKPLYFFYDKKLKRLAMLKGRTLPKVKRDNAWRDLDAFLKYHY